MVGSTFARGPVRRALFAVLSAPPPYRWDVNGTGAVEIEPRRARDERSYVVYFSAFQDRRESVNVDRPAAYLVVASESRLRLTSCPMTATKFVSAWAAKEVANALPSFPWGGPPAEVRELTLFEHPHNYVLSDPVSVPTPKEKRKVGKLKDRPSRGTPSSKKS